MSEREREREPKFRRLNFSLSGIGCLATTSILTITISCSHSNAKEEVELPIIKNSLFDPLSNLKGQPFRFLESEKKFIVDKEKLEKPNTILSAIYKFTENERDKILITDENNTMELNDNLLVVYKPNDSYVLENGLYANELVYSFRNIYVDRDKNEPIFNGNNGAGTINISQVQVKNTTVKYEWKNDSRGTYYDLNVSDNNFNNGEIVRVTWTANDGYLLHNNKSTYSQEYTIKNLITTTPNVPLKFEPNKHKPIFKGNSGTGTMDISQVTVPNATATYSWKNASGGNYKNLNTSASNFNNGETVKITWFANNGYLLDINNKQQFNYSQEYLISNLNVNKDDAFISFNNKDNSPIFHGESGKGEMDISQVAIDNTTVKYEWKNARGGNYQNLNTSASDFHNGETVKVTWTTNDGYLFKENKSRLYFKEYAISQLSFSPIKYLQEPQANLYFSGTSGAGVMDISEIHTPKTTVKYEWKNGLGGAYQNLNTSDSNFGDGEMVRVTWTTNHDYLFAKNKSKFYIKEYTITTLGSIEIPDVNKETHAPIFNGNTGTGTMDISQVAIPNTTVKYERKNASNGAYQNLNTSASDFHNNETVRITWTANNGYLFANKTRFHRAEYVVNFLTENKLNVDWSTKAPIFSGATGAGVMDISPVDIANTSIAYEWKNARGGNFQTLNTGATNFRNRETVRITWTANDGYVLPNKTQTHSIEYLITSLTETELNIDWSTKAPIFSGVSGAGVMNISQVSIPNVTVAYEWKNASGGNFQTLNTGATNFRNRETVRITWTANDGYVLPNKTQTHSIEYLITSLTETELNIDWSTKAPIFSGVSGAGVMDISPVDIANTSIAYEWKNASGGNFQTLNTGATNFRNRETVRITWTANDGYIFPNKAQSHSVEYLITSLTETELNIDWSTKAPIFSGVSGAGVMDISPVDIANTSIAYEWKNASGGNFQTLNTGATNFRNRETVRITWTANDGYIFPNKAQSHSVEYLITSLTRTELNVDWSSKNPVFIGASSTAKIDASSIAISNTIMKYELENTSTGNFEIVDINTTKFANGQTLRITWIANNGYEFSGGSKTQEKSFFIKDLVSPLLQIDESNNKPIFTKDANDNFSVDISNIVVDNTTIWFEWQESTTSEFTFLTKDEVVAKKDFIKDGILKISWIANKGFHFANNESSFIKDFIVV